MSKSKRRGALWAFLLTAVACTSADLCSKQFVFNWVETQPDQRVVLIPHRFEFLARLNDAGIWSVGRGVPYSNVMLTVFCAVAAVAIVCWGVFALPGESPFMAYVAGAILGGALGNLHDRIRFEGVRDFIQVYLWGGYAYPTFNLADSFLICGAVSLALATARGGSQPAAAAPLNDV